MTYQRDNEICIITRTCCNDYLSVARIYCWQVASSYRDAVSSSIPCIHEGHLKTDRNWFGYLANITVIGSGRLTFEFIYPVERCCQNILFYRQDQLAIIGACVVRHSIGSLGDKYCLIDAIA